jgi:uncharacterized protein YggE
MTRAISIHLVAGTLLVAWAAVAAPQQAAAQPGPVRGEIVVANLPASVTVAGTGEARGKPDTADINVGVQTQAETAAEALAANNEAMSQVMTLLKEQGIAENDIQTSNFSVSPQYQRNRPGNEPPKVVGYQVINQVRIKLRDLSKLGGLLDAVVREGANSIYGISFTVTDPQQLQDEALRKAVADARRKAELLAGEAGQSLGEPYTIQEQSAEIPRPMTMRAFAAGAAVEAVPVATGEYTVRASVTITYYLEGPKTAATAR